jgi:hypothetical protein
VHHDKELINLGTVSKSGNNSATDNQQHMHQFRGESKEAIEHFTYHVLNKLCNQSHLKRP